MMIGWRRKAKAERARLENPMSAEHLYELVNQTLLANFGPLGSYAITRRASSDSDDIFHTMLASSVAHDIASTLINHNAVPLKPLAPVAGSFVGATSAFSSTRALPAEPLAALGLAPLRVGAHAAPEEVASVVAVAEVVATRVEVSAVEVAAVEVSPVEVAAVEVSPVVAPVSVATAALTTAALPILPLPVSAVTAPAASSAEAVAEPVSARPAPLAPLAPIVAVPVSADLAAALVELDRTGPIDVAPAAAAPVSAAPVSAARANADFHLIDADR